VVPIFTANKTVSFCMTGQSEFDHVKFPYFYRLVPPDLSESYAMIWIANSMRHYKRIALAFGNDIGSQTFIAPAIAAIKAAGETLVANQTLDLHATTFRTEAAKIVAAKPDVILTEALGPPEAAFLSEVKQLNGGKLPPVIGTSATISPDWFKSVSAAVGGNAFANFWADNLVTETSGPAYDAFSKAIFAEKGKVGSTGDFSTYLTAPGAVHLYDGINLASLAMIQCKSTNPTVFKTCIEKIGDGVPGATTVYSFAQGAAALKAGKAIRYVGPGGPTSFDAYHDSTGIFQVDTYTPQGQVNVTANIPTSQLRALGL
jgi:branched-chain amino acid transport system substrate-binding protein